MSKAWLHALTRLLRRAGIPSLALIAGAATMDEQMAIDYDMDTFSRVMRINIDGTMATAQAAAKLMRQNGQGGSIVIIASISGQIANRVSAVRFDLHHYNY